MKIEIEYGYTANAGNYESVRVACRLEAHTKTDDVEEIKQTQNKIFKRAKKFVQDKIKEELGE